MNQRESDPFSLEPELEEPVAIDNPEANLGSLFSDDMPVISTKLNVLESLFQLVTRDVKFSDFMRELLLIVMRAAKSEAGSILELNYNDNTFFFRAAVGTSSDRIVRFVIPIGQGIVGHVAESRQPVVVSNVGENKRHLKAIQESVGFPARNMVALPIVIRGKVFGVLELLNRIGEETYSSSDIELLTNLCSMAARAIEIRLMIAWSKSNSAKGSQERVA